MKKLLYVLLTILLAQTAFAQSASLHWEFAGWYGGGCYPDLVFDPHVKDRVYLTSDVAGLWRSDDLGEHWHFITKGLGQLVVPALAVAPSDSNVLYAATGGGLYISKNAGDSWTSTDEQDGAITFKRPENYRPIAIDAQHPNQLCVATAKAQVFCSKDFGSTWKNIDPDRKSFPDQMNISAIDLTKDGKLLVASNNGLNICDINTSKCQAMAQGPSIITDFVRSQKSPNVLYAAGSEMLWSSSDNGSSWSQMSAIPEGKTFRIALDESGDLPIIRVIWLDAWKGGVLVSRDQGKSWESQDDQLNADRVSDPTRLWAANGGKSNSVQVDPFNPEIIFRTDWWGVWRSDDGGKSWNEKINGAPNSVATQISIATNSDIYVSSMDNGLLRSKDGGKAYEMLFPKQYDPSQSGHVWRVLTTADAIIGTSSPWNDPVNQVIISHDSGNSFSLINSGLPSSRPKGNTMWSEGYPRALTMDPHNPDIIYLGIDGDDGGGLFVSRDIGQTWQRSIGQPGSLRIYNGLAVDPTDSNRILWGASGLGGGVYLSEDAGKTFKLTEGEMSWVFGVTISPDGTMYAAGASNGSALFTSNNHGHSWKLVKNFDKDLALVAVAIDPLNPKIIATSSVSWTSQPGKIFLSKDAGKNWQDITGDLPNGTGASSMAFDPKGKYLYIARYAGSVYKISL